jgi:predicted esterase
MKNQYALILTLISFNSLWSGQDQVITPLFRHTVDISALTKYEYAPSQEPSNSVPQEPMITFLHGSRGNGTRIKNYRMFLPSGLPECAPDGPDHIPEEVSVNMHHDVNQATNRFSKFYAQVKRELILLEALRRSTMAQEGDMLCVLKRLEQAGAIHADKLIFGDSKGGALALNLLGAGLLPQARGVVVFSPYFHTDLAVLNFVGTPQTKLMQGYVGPAFRALVTPMRSERGPQPAISVQGIAKHAKETPILIGALMNDTKVPAYDQLALYIRLKEAGCNVRLVTVEEGIHGELAKSPEHERLAAVVQSFWHKKSGVKQEKLALKGNDHSDYDIDHARYAPTAQDVRNLMKTRFNLTPEDLDARVQFTTYDDSTTSSCIRTAGNSAGGVIFGGIAGKLLNNDITGGMLLGAAMANGCAAVYEIHPWYSLYKTCKDLAEMKRRLIDVKVIT